MGAVLSQRDAEGNDHPVAYFSRKLLPRELEVRYSTIEKECLAIKLTVQSFRVYLLGREFTVQTDHRSLEWMDRLKENNSRLTRWSLSLQPFSLAAPATEIGKGRQRNILQSDLYVTYDQTHVVTTEWPLSVEGCNFFRQRQVLATHSDRTIKITKIRVDDDYPGLGGDCVWVGEWGCASVCHVYVCNHINLVHHG